MIHVVAVITAEPGKREEVLAAFRANVPAVRAEKGCIEYGAALETANAGPSVGAVKVVFEGPLASFRRSPAVEEAAPHVRTLATR